MHPRHPYHTRVATRRIMEEHKQSLGDLRADVNELKEKLTYIMQGLQTLLNQKVVAKRTVAAQVTPTHPPGFPLYGLTIGYTPTLTNVIMVNPRNLQLLPMPYTPYPYTATVAPNFYPKNPYSNTPYNQLPHIKTPTTEAPVVVPTNISPPQTSKPKDQKKECIKFDPIPMTYGQLLPHLLQNYMVSLIPTKPFKPPFPAWYDPNTNCKFHSGAKGHSIESCFALKKKVQSLLNDKWLTFKEDGMNVKDNPLTGHAGSSVNAIEEQISDGVV